MICQECQMAVDETEYHPYAACLMYSACMDAGRVRDNLNAVIAWADGTHESRHLPDELPHIPEGNP